MHCSFYPNLQWYVDVMLSLIERAGEFATRDIWHATLQLITNDQGLHEYAARKVGSSWRIPKLPAESPKSL